MTKEDLSFLKEWFPGYCESFNFAGINDQKNIYLKIVHSNNVCENITTIAKELHLCADEVMVAETIGLFHDVGRFLQFARYRTFNDRISVNHGKLGAEVLLKENVLKNLPEGEQELILHSVKYHNAFKLPRMNRNSKKPLFLKMIRDADKLDIWLVFDEYYETDESERPSVAAHGLPDVQEYSEKILSSILKGEMASFKHVKTLTDLKLLQLSWIYDLNFRTSFGLLLERGIIEKIVSKLPSTGNIRKVSASLHKYARGMAV